MTASSADANAIEAREVTKIYKGGFSRKILALDALSLQVKSGEIFGLLGPNGAGKTTLVKLLLDIIRPTRGSTFLFGVGSRKRLARERVGYLPEDHLFPGYLTGMGALELYGGLSGLSRREIRRRGEEALARVDLAEWAKVKTRKYSKGMKQRLGIAQAIFHEPDLLLLDEPTDGVDPVGRKAIRGLLLEYNEKGKTVFINSHLLLEVEMICHRVVILNKGKVQKTGTVEELTSTKDEYRVKAGGDPKAALLVVMEHTDRAEIKEDGIHFHVEDEAGLDRITVALGAAGHPIREVVPVKATLEDIFIDVIQGSRKTNGKQEKQA